MSRNRNVSSAQFGTYVTGGEEYPYTMSDKDWEARSAVINSRPSRPYIDRDEDEDYRANFGDDYLTTDPSFGMSTRNQPLAGTPYSRSRRNT